jgi:CTD small phosphatase-like protein 2
MWVKKLNNLTYRYDPKVKSVNSIFDEINSINNKLMQKLYPNLLQLYKKPILFEIFSKLEILTQIELQRIYKERIFVNMNINGSIIGSSAYFQKNKNYLNYSNNNKNIYFLNKKPTKNYTLVLDLDETLIHFKSNPNDDNSGLLQFRPFINEFLFGVSKFYELIVFTAATEDYADPIIDAIEKKGIKFEKRLYRIHTVVINNDFVKDLSRLGRDLSRTIIVDNMEQNYKLQPENGITIRPFWGKDANDMALVDLLGILKEIAKNKMDVRAGISYFKEDIISKVTSNIFRRVQI